MRIALEEWQSRAADQLVAYTWALPNTLPSPPRHHLPHPRYYRSNRNRSAELALAPRTSSHTQEDVVLTSRHPNKASTVGTQSTRHQAPAILYWSSIGAWVRAWVRVCRCAEVTQARSSFCFDFTSHQPPLDKLREASGRCQCKKVQLWESALFALRVVW